MTLLNLPTKQKNESAHRFNVRFAKTVDSYQKIARTYKEAKVKLPKQLKDEKARPYVERLIRQFRTRSEKAKEKAIEKWSVSVSIFYEVISPADTFLLPPSKYYVTTGLYDQVPLKMQNRIPSEWHDTWEYDHEPTKEELLSDYKILKEELIKEKSKAILFGYTLLIFKFGGSVMQEPIHLVKNNIRHIVMKQSINKNCVIELLSKNYNVPEKELDEFFGNNTTPEKIDEWCQINQVPHYAFDLCNNAIYRTPCKSKKRALIYVAADEHINEVNNQKQRNKLIKTKTLAQTKINDIKKAKPNTQQLKLLNIPYPVIHSPDDFKENKSIYNKIAKLKGNYYTTDNLLYIFLSITVFNKRPPMTLADNNTIYKITFKDFTIALCTKEQLALHESLDIPFNGKRISEIVCENIDVPMDKLESKYNVQTYDVIKRAHAYPLHYNYTSMTAEELNEHRSKNNLVNVDIKRCYPFICMNYPMPYLTSDQTFELYDGTPKPNYWYVVEPLEYNIILGKCTFVPYEVLQYTNNIKITHQIKPKYTNVLQTKYKTLSEDPKYKILGNMFIGLLSRTSKKKANVIYTYSVAEIGYYAFLTGSKVNYLDFNNKRLYKTLPVVQNDVNQFKYRMAYLQITMLSRMLCMKMLADIKTTLKNFIPIQINTDGILGLQKKKVSLKFLDETSKTKPGDIRKKPINEFIAAINKTEHATYSNGEISLDQFFSGQNLSTILSVPKINKVSFDHRWNAEEIWDFVKDKPGCLFMGDPGSGKTHALISIQERTPKDTTITTTFTRLASTLIPNSKSCHEIFNVRTIENFDVSDNILRYYKDHVTHLLVDECSMISREIYEVLSLLKSINPEIKIFLFGDKTQFRPIGSIAITHDDPLMRFITGGNEIELNHQFRSDKDYINNLKKENYNDLKHVKSDVCTKFNITLTNNACDKLNEKCVELYGNIDKSGSYIRFDKTTKLNGEKIPKNLLAEVDIVGQNVYITQLYNGRIELSLEYKIKQDAYMKMIRNGNVKPGYTITAYRSQGITINEPYTIHEWNHKYMDKTAKYVAASRTTNKELCFYNTKPLVEDTSQYEPMFGNESIELEVENEYELDINNNIWDSI